MDKLNQGNAEYNILIVDDTTSNLVILAEMIKSIGYIARPVTSVKQAFAAISKKIPHLILLDISMPDIDGFECCEMLKKDVKTKDIPIIFISALNSTEDKIRGFKLGAVDFIVKPFELEEITLRVNTHLKLYQMQQELKMHNRRLFKMVNEHVQKISDEQKNIIYALMKLSEARDDSSGTHIENVGKNCKLLAMSLQFSPKFEKEVTTSFIDAIELAAPLHDIGKMAIRDNILLKPGKLTTEEMKIMKTHAEIGASNLSEIYNYNEHNDFILMAIDIAHYHHENWDGSGYPKGLKGKEIPLAARITAVVDVYDILTSDRCYRKAFSHEDAMQIMIDDAGKAFDPDIIEIFVKIQNQLKKH